MVLHSTVERTPTAWFLFTGRLQRILPSSPACNRVPKTTPDSSIGPGQYKDLPAVLYPDILLILEHSLARSLRLRKSRERKKRHCLPNQSITSQIQVFPSEGGRLLLNIKAGVAQHSHPDWSHGYDIMQGPLGSGAYQRAQQ
ncbi:uncharacterized protein ACNLHF_023399 isoform 1-T1 [Anomaloglossus baeobatrachus]